MTEDVQDTKWVFRVIEGTNHGYAVTRFNLDQLPEVVEGLSLRDEFAQGGKPWTQKLAPDSERLKCFDLRAKGTEVELTISRALFSRVQERSGFGLS